MAQKKGLKMFNKYKILKEKIDILENDRALIRMTISTLKHQIEILEKQTGIIKPKFKTKGK